jgi:phosphate-selective porin
MKDVIMKAKIDVYDFNLSKVAIDRNTRLSDFNVKSGTQHLAFYKDGELKKEIDLDEVTDSDLSSTIEQFIKSMKSTYINEGAD